MNELEVWDVMKGPGDVVMAVIDIGVDVDHPNRRGALWVSEAEASGRLGVDEDRNGYVDDVHGYDFANGDGTVSDF